MSSDSLPAAARCLQEQRLAELVQARSRAEAEASVRVEERAQAEIGERSAAEQRRAEEVRLAAASQARAGSRSARARSAAAERAAAEEALVEAVQARRVADGAAADEAIRRLHEEQKAHVAAHARRAAEEAAASAAMARAQADEQAARVAAERRCTEERQLQLAEELRAEQPPRATWRPSDLRSEAAATAARQALERIAQEKRDRRSRTWLLAAGVASTAAIGGVFMLERTPQALSAPVDISPAAAPTASARAPDLSSAATYPLPLTDPVSLATEPVDGLRLTHDLARHPAESVEPR